MTSLQSKRLRALAPFAAAAFFPIFVTPLPGPSWDAGLLALGMGLSLAILVLALLVPWERLPNGSDALPVLAYLGVIAILREAGGGNASGLGPMVLLPVIWLALYGSRVTLGYAILGAAMVYWVPILLDSTGERYPASGWRIGAIFLPLLAVLGFTVQRLVGQVRHQRDRLARLAHTDELTGLPNRRAWDIALDAVLRAAEREHPRACVALIDVDSFKGINDREGHGAGDDVLVHLAAAWLAELRRGDTLARIGGDEFAVLLPNCSAEDATFVLERVRATSAGTTASIGLAEWVGGERGTDLIRRADRALYAAKRQGGDRLHVAAPSPDALVATA